MALSNKLDDIAAAIKDLESRFQYTSIQLQRRKEEEIILIALKNTLEDNLIELKKENVIIMAKEFFKAKEDLVKAKTRLAFLEIDMETHNIALKAQAEMLTIFRKKQADIIELMTNNIVYINFRRKDGR